MRNSRLLKKGRRYLLDTHVFVWWMGKSKRLNRDIETLLSDQNNEVILSVISIWEIVIKIRIGKLKPPKNWKKTLLKSGFEIMPVNLEHAYKLETLPLYHKDPFDRMLIAQALAEKCILITVDEKIKRYKVKTIS